jgi:DNA helicase II / ATP-dependent DNA helicase PcrA
MTDPAAGQGNGDGPVSAACDAGSVTIHQAVRDRIAALAPDQRRAATAPPGPVLCVAPAGSGKTTTLVARVAWLVAGGHPPARTCVVTFNRRAAEEVVVRLDAALAPLGVTPGEVRVRTFHALAREILADAGRPVEPLADRAAVLTSLLGAQASPQVLRALDDAFSRLKLEVGLDSQAVSRLPVCDPARDPPGARVRGVFIAYEAALASGGALDFDDLVRNAVTLLETNLGVRQRWRERCTHLLVDEVQDLDRSQLRLALLLAAPEYRLFLVGDDDQTIYAWRLADVRRILDLAGRVPGLRRVDLVTNYRCPAPVVERAVRLVECNNERFTKRIVARAAATGDLRLAPDSGDDVARARRLLRAWPPGGPATSPGRAAILARTNAELVPYAAAAIESRIAFRVEADGLLLDSPGIDGLVTSLGARGADGDPDGVGPGADARGTRDLVSDLHRAVRGQTPEAGVAALLLGWAPAASGLRDLAARIGLARAQLDILRDDEAPLVLATVHGTKGLEFDHVAVVGLDDERFPSARSLAEAADPRRALEEERRLAYVAWTRARRSLVLVYDPGAPSRFMREAFDRRELDAAAGRVRH